jgi:hypothetical protein
VKIETANFYFTEHVRPDQKYAVTDLQGNFITKKFYDTPVAAVIAAKNVSYKTPKGWKHYKEGEFVVHVIESNYVVTSLNGKQL